jgi:hypothetical protein
VRLHLQSIFAAAPEVVWDRALQPLTRPRLTRPLIALRPTDTEVEKPHEWYPGLVLDYRLRFLGLLPLGRYRIEVTDVDVARREIRTRERSWLVPAWTHLMRVRRLPDGRTLYADLVEIPDGARAPLGWLLGRVVLLHHHRRWPRLLKEDQDRTR